MGGGGGGGGGGGYVLNRERETERGERGERENKKLHLNTVPHVTLVFCVQLIILIRCTLYVVDALMID